MIGLKAVLAVAGAAVVAAILTPTEASAGWRGAYGDCFARLPSYGYDGCGLREFRYGPGSCWRRVEAYTPAGPRARRVWICGRSQPFLMTDIGVRAGPLG